jgi:hypothetical protein
MSVLNAMSGIYHLGWGIERIVAVVWRNGRDLAGGLIGLIQQVMI